MNKTELLDWLSKQIDLLLRAKEETIYKDLLMIADEGELEELRSAVEAYFNFKSRKSHETSEKLLLGSNDETRETP